jgi:hypothetical protein
MTPNQSTRSESQIFEELKALCVQPGFAHAIAHLCFRDNTLKYGDVLKTEDLQDSYDNKHLIRTELNTLIGLMYKGTLDFTLPDQTTLGNYISKADELLLELHHSLTPSPFDELAEGQIPENFDPFSEGKYLREPIFYSGEGAYDFQYRELALIKYAADSKWLQDNRGFEISEAIQVLSHLQVSISNAMMSQLQSLLTTHPDKWTFLPALVVNINDLSNVSNFPREKVERIINEFTLPTGNKNNEFNALNDFNIAVACPFIRINHDEYIIFQLYSLYESIYESPFFWFLKDKLYLDTALGNRGSFTEQFCAKRLTDIFNPQRVFSNVTIRDKSGNDIAEIDILVLFGNRAIIFQTKSKRLTLASRKGNDNSLRDDFQKSIQDAYNQGLKCAALFDDTSVTFFKSDGQILTLKHNVSIKYIVCAICDHYPALAFQARQFLKYTATENVPAPFIMDIFTLDAMAEMLDTPLYFLDYIDKRTRSFEKIAVTHEFTTLSYHLKQNLWLGEEYNMMYLHDDITADLDIAMMARRTGIEGARTPTGILTQFVDKSVGALLRDLEAIEDPMATNLAIMLLSVSGDTLNDLDKAIDELCNRGRRDGLHHDITLCFGKVGEGLTVHFNRDNIEKSRSRLLVHAERRKYSEKCDRWFGICIDPFTGKPRFGLELNEKWEFDAQKEAALKKLPVGIPGKSLIALLQSSPKKYGRNEPCPCGSGKKFKKCCLK